MFRKGGDVGGGIMNNVAILDKTLNLKVKLKILQALKDRIDFIESTGVG